MAEKHTAMTPSREERRTGLSRPLGATNPFRSLQRFADEMDRVFEDFGFGRSWLSPSWRESGFGGVRESALGGWAPQVEVFHKNNELTIRADLPGLKKDEVSVEVTDEAVTIQGERKREHEEEREGFYRSERSYGSFSRVIPLPDGAMTEQAKAEFRDGVLEITMPAPPKSLGRRIEISEASATK
jgi:HSP20 family protein